MLIALLLAGLSTNAHAQVQLLKNLKLAGEVHLQTTAAQNTADFTTHPTVAAKENDRIGSAQTMVMLRADWDLLDDVHARVTLAKNDRDWGTSNTVGNAHGN